MPPPQLLSTFWDSSDGARYQTILRYSPTKKRLHGGVYSCNSNMINLMN